MAWERKRGAPAFTSGDSDAGSGVRPLGLSGDRSPPGSPGSLASLDSAARPPGSLPSDGSSVGEPAAARTARSGGSRSAGGDQAAVDVGAGGGAVAGGARGDADGASGTRVLNKLNSGGIEHGLGKSRNRKLTKFVLRGPLSAQPVERPRDARFPWFKLASLISIFLLGMWTILSFEVVCLLKDVCFRTDAAVVVVGSIGALPLAAAIVLILVPVGFYGAYYQNRYVLFGYIVAAALIGTVLLLGASFSWAESTDSAALDHAEANWGTLTINERAYFHGNVVEMRDMYQESALMFGFVAFVGFIVLAVSGCSVLCLCLMITSPELCGRAPRDTLAY